MSCLKSALKIGGTAVGAYFGGPVGAKIGGSLGGLAGNALGGGGKGDVRTGTNATNPTLSPQWQAAYGGASGNINGMGFSPGQAAAYGLLGDNAASNPVNGATDAANSFLGTSINNLSYLQQRTAPFLDQDARLLGAAPTVNARTGASFAGDYTNPYERNVVDATTRDFNDQTARTMAARRQARDSAGAFGDRTAVADAAYGAEDDKNLGSLLANLRYQGFNAANQFGQSDANRFLSADQANANIQDSRDKFDITSGYQNDQQKLGAIRDAATNVLATVNLSEQQKNNIITANGINMDAAKALFDAGTIGQSELDKLVELSKTANGSTQTSSGTANRYGYAADQDSVLGGYLDDIWPTPEKERAVLLGGV